MGTAGSDPTGAEGGEVAGRRALARFGALAAERVSLDDTGALDGFGEVNGACSDRRELAAAVMFVAAGTSSRCGEEMAGRLRFVDAVRGSVETAASTGASTWRARSCSTNRW